MNEQRSNSLTRFFQKAALPLALGAFLMAAEGLPSTAEALDKPWWGGSMGKKISCFSGRTDACEDNKALANNKSEEDVGKNHDHHMVRDLYGNPEEACIEVGQKWYETLKDIYTALTTCKDINARDYSGNTPLHWAVGFWHTKIAEALIAKGADVKAKDKYGDTPLHFAARHKNKEIAVALIANGADINAKDVEGTTPLHVAAAYGNEETVQFLIAKGADINVEKDDRQTPLMLALQYKHREIIKMLREAAEKELKQKILKTIEGLTP